MKVTKLILALALGLALTGASLSWACESDAKSDKTAACDSKDKTAADKKDKAQGDPKQDAQKPADKPAQDKQG